METTMYDNLLLLPLFQGLSKNEFTTIIEKVKFHFRTYPDGETIIRQGDNCRELCFLLNGEVNALTSNEEHSYSIQETIGSPYIIEPQSLFGMYPYYTATYRAKTQANILTIDKSYIFSELNNHEIFRLNYLNILSNRSQIANRRLWNNHAGTLRQKFLNFIASRCRKPDGEKTVQTSMDNLSRLIGETRINVSRLLKELQDKELVLLKRKEIFIPHFEKLTEYLV